jgi:hypothetical protein
MWLKSHRPAQTLKKTLLITTPWVASDDTARHTPADFQSPCRKRRNQDAEPSGCTEDWIGLDRNAPFAGKGGAGSRQI